MAKRKERRQRKGFRSPERREMKVLNEVAAQAEAMGAGSYGERAVKQFRGKSKNVCMLKRSLVNLLDSAHRAGEEENMEWAKGVIEQKNEKIKALEAEHALMISRLRLYKFSLEAALDKLGVRTDAI